MTESTRRLRHRPFTTRALVLLATVASLGLGCRAQNSNDAPTGVPSASFTVTATSGQPGLMVSFADTSTGEFDTLLWDFGDGMTSTDPNPTYQFDDPGTFDVSLTVTGTRGSDTSITQVQIAALPTAGFTCTPEVGFAPFMAVCTSSATNATNVNWTFVNDRTSATTVATGASPAVTFDDADTYTVTQTVDNGIGDSDVAMGTIEGYPLAINSSVPSGTGPGTVAFTADIGGAAGLGGLLAWFVDGVLVSTSTGFFADLRTPGTYTIEFTFGSSTPPLVGTTSIQHVVGFGTPTAAFSASETEGAGPLDVTFTDESTGIVNSWTWDFGDGTLCVFPEPPVLPPGTVGCTSASPSHTYGAVGRYDVTLTITGEQADPNLPDLTDAITIADAVSVTIVDPSFEEQGVASPIGGAWTAITPAAPTAAADHVALSDTESGGADAGMPTDGQKWAALDGLGTDGTETALLVENGVRQDFLLPTGTSVLEFDYVLLYSEPTLGTVFDAMTATVSDGTTTVEVTSARADVLSPYAGGSGRYPTLDGSTTRATPVQTASLDVATAFPGADPDTIYTLTVRLTNDVNDFRSPRAYVDHVRFTTPAAPLVASFSAPAMIVAGEPADFMDETCLDPVGLGCEVPTSWRWDFDTHLSVSPPSATGSGEQDPTYTFAESGDYDVRLLARNGDQESLATMTVSVLAAPVAVPDILSQTDTDAPATITFQDLSTSDPSDAIVAWSWDFAGFGTSTAQNPTPVTITQAGTWTIRLTITTASGQTDTQSIDVVLD